MSSKIPAIQSSSRKVYCAASAGDTKDARPSTTTFHPTEPRSCIASAWETSLSFRPAGGIAATPEPAFRAVTAKVVSTAHRLRSAPSQPS